MLRLTDRVPMRHGRFLFVFAGATLWVMAATPAFGVPTFFILQRDMRFLQTGPSTTTSDGFTFQGRATPNDGVGPIDFDGGTITFPASSPLAPATLNPNGAELSYSSGKVTDQTAFQTNYPASGTYTFHMTDSHNAAHTQTQAVDHSAGTPVVTIPALTAASFTGLQGMDASKAITVNWNSFADQGTGALIFFAIQDTSGNTPVFDGLQPGVTQDVIPANTLSPGTSYKYFLFFENNAVSGATQVTFDNRTSGSFATQAVPEPGSTLPFLGAGGVIGSRQPRRRR